MRKSGHVLSPVCTGRFGRTFTIGDFSASFQPRGFRSLPIWFDLLHRLAYFVNHPSDFVIEVQLQDIKSYLLSIAKGRSTAHASLKMDQIRSNSFDKFFPSEIYEQDVTDLKLRVLGRPQGG